MPAIRSLLAQRHLAALICAAALLLKLLVPAGYMIAVDEGRFTITLCSGTAPRTVTMTMPGMHGDMAGMHGAAHRRIHASGHGAKDHGGSTDHDKAEMPCAFAGLTAASLAAVDAILLATLIAFVMTVGPAGRALPPTLRRAHLRPPLRGPPAGP